MDCSLPGSSVHGILQARILDWVAFPSPGDLPNAEMETVSLTSPALPTAFLLLVCKGLTSYAPSHNSPIKKGRIILSIYHVTGKSGLKKKSLLPEESEPSTNWNWGPRGGRESVHTLLCCHCNDIMASCAQRCEHSWADPHMLKLFPAVLAPESRWGHQCDLTSESIQMKGSVV